MTYDMEEKIISIIHHNLTHKKGRPKHAPNMDEMQNEINRIKLSIEKLDKMEIYLALKLGYEYAPGGMMVNDVIGKLIKEIES